MAYRVWYRDETGKMVKTSRLTTYEEAVALEKCFYGNYSDITIKEEK